MQNVKIKLTVLREQPKHIAYGFVHTAFGQVMLACFGGDNSSPQLCHLKFVHDDDKSRADGIRNLEQRFPGIAVQLNAVAAFGVAQRIFKLSTGNVTPTNKDTVTPIDIVLCGTEFQNRVWRKLAEHITWGKQCSYSDLAQEIGQPRAARAVANAMAHNDVCILIPCHRVVAKSADTQKKMQYGGGAHIKRQLLDYEAANAF